LINRPGPDPKAAAGSVGEPSSHRGRGQPRVEVEEAPAGVADDAAGIVGAGDHLDRPGERLVCQGVNVGWIAGADRCFEDVHGLVHLGPVRVRGAPAVQLGSGADQRQYGVGESGHSVSSRRGLRMSATSSMP